MIQEFILGKICKQIGDKRRFLFVQREDRDPIAQETNDSEYESATKEINLPPLKAQ